MPRKAAGASQRPQRVTAPAMQSSRGVAKAAAPSQFPVSQCPDRSSSAAPATRKVERNGDNLIREERDQREVDIDESDRDKLMERS